MPTMQISLFDFVADEPVTQAAPSEDASMQAQAPIGEVYDLTELSAVNADPEPEETTKATPEKKSGRGRQRIEDFENIRLDVPDDETLFSKQYYGIGEVSRMFSANISQIRFWEKEFPILKPRKNGKGDRLFRPEDIKNLKLIHHLLRERKYTIEGAKEFLRNHKNAAERYSAIESLQQLRSFLTELKLTL